MRVRTIFLLTTIAAVLLSLFYFDINFPQLLKDALAWIDGLGSGGPVIFIGLYILSTVFFLPGSILTLGAGAVFGVAAGSIYVIIGSNIGAVCAFLVGRYLIRGVVSGWAEERPKFKAVDSAIGREGWKIVILTRLSPIFPFNFLNYAFGITSVQLKHYFLASLIGMLPGTVMYVYLGSVVGELARLGADGRQRTTLQWALYIVGLIATVAVALYVTKVAKKTLAEHVEEEPLIANG